MTVVLLTDSFLKKEFSKVKKQYTLDNIKAASGKAALSGVDFSHLGYTHGSLVKVRMPGKVAGRMVVFLFRTKDIVVPIVVRLKSDKVIGSNLALNNKRAKKLLLDMLDAVMGDIKNGRYEKIKI